MVVDIYIYIIYDSSKDEDSYYGLDLILRESECDADDSFSNNKRSIKKVRSFHD